MEQGMTFAIESNGEKQYYSVNKIYPLSLDDFDKETSKVKVSGEKVNFIEGQTVVEAGDYYFDVKHYLTKNAFILSNGGWLPPSYCIERRYLLDRNVVSAIEGNALDHYSVFLEWFNVIRNSNEIQFSTLFSAIEKHGVFPDFISFKKNINADSQVLKNYFKECLVLDLSVDATETIYEFIKDLRLKNLIDFIIEASNIIIKQKPKLERRKYAEKIIGLAKYYKLSGKIHLVILCLSCLYAKDSSFARNIIKPKKLVGNNPDIQKNAMNCINDTVFIDLILLMKKHVSESFSGITLDKAIAQYWCALNPEIDGKSNNFMYKFDMSNKLFNSASLSDLDFLSQSINELQIG